MQRTAKRTISICAVGIACALLVTLFGCSELGKRYITVDVQSDPPGASVFALIDNKISGGTFSPGSLGTTPTGKKTMHFAFGAPGVRDTRLGVRVEKPGFKTYEVFFIRDECYSSAEEALKNVKHIVAKLTPAERTDEK